MGTNYYPEIESIMFVVGFMARDIFLAIHMKGFEKFVYNHEEDFLQLASYHGYNEENSIA